VELTTLAQAHRRLRAIQMVELMVAAQGDEKSWKAQIKRLVKIIEA
jgi:hypothetical protein